MPNNIYSNARAISLENSLLGLERLNRIMDCNSPEDALKVLQEVNFGDGVIIDNALEYDKLIENEEKKLISFILETSPDKNFTEFLLLKYDYHNAEAIMKAKYLKIEPDKMLGLSGMIDSKELKEKIMLDEYKSFSKNMQEALLMSDNLFVSGKANGQNIGQLFKKALYNDLSKASKKNSELKKIYQAKADATNISIALRLRNYNEASEFFVDGTLKKSELKSLCEDSSEILKDKFRYFYLKDLIMNAIEEFSLQMPLTNTERLADSYALKLLKQNKYASSGIKPYIIYCYYKLAEISNVRIIMSALCSKVEKSLIKERVRETYEG